VNSTLGFLKVAPRTLFLRPDGGTVRIQWNQARPARVTVRVETMHGILLQTVAQRAFAAGQSVVLWNGRRRDGRLAYGGRYRVLVLARNELGSVSLEQALTVRRVAARR
jgi:flagellar hook assembly protein FlgD